MTGAYPPEPASDLGDLTALSGSRTRWGTVNRTSDAHDYYRFTLNGTHRMRFELRELGADADLYLLDGSGRELDASTHAATENDSVERTLDAGTYYVRVDAYAGGGIVYQLRYSRVSFEFPPERPTDLGNLTALAVPRTRSGSVNSSFDEHDYYRFTLDTARTMRFELRELGADADLYLLDSSGRELASSGYSGTEIDSIERSLPDGTYYIRVDAYDSGNIAYQLRYGQATPPRQPDLEVAQLDVGGDGRLIPGARGTVAITLRNRGNRWTQHGFDYALYLSADSEITSGDTRLALHGNGAGRVSYGLAEGETREVGDVAFTVPSNLSAGTYYIGVIADSGGEVSESDESNNTLSKRITVAPAVDVFPPEEPIDLGNLVSLLVDGYRHTQRGALRRGSDEYDYYRFTLDATRTLEFRFGGLGGMGLHLLDPSEQTIAATISDGGFTETLEAGTYYILVDGRLNASYSFQIYRSGFRPEEAIDLGNLTAQSGTGTLTGVVDQGTGVRHFHRFTLDATRTIRFELSAGRIQHLSFLDLLDSSGQRLATSADSGRTDNHVEHSLGEGTYYIVVQATSPIRTSEYQLRYRRVASTEESLTEAATGPDTLAALSGTGAHTRGSGAIMIRIPRLRPPYSATKSQRLWRDEAAPAALTPWLDERNRFAGAGSTLAV